MGRTSRGDNKSKQQRQQAILRLIQENPISRQETLLEYLSKEGFDATQATISRDIKELRLIKALSEKGVYKYAPIEKGDHRSQSALMRIFADTVVQIEPTGHLIVIRTLTGSANAAAEAAKRAASGEANARQSASEAASSEAASSEAASSEAASSVAA